MCEGLLTAGRRQHTHPIVPAGAESLTAIRTAVSRLSHLDPFGPGSPSNLRGILHRRNALEIAMKKEKLIEPDDS